MLINVLFQCNLYHCDYQYNLYYFNYIIYALVGEATPSPSLGGSKSGLSRRQRKNCRKREKLDTENKQVVIASNKSVEIVGLAGSSCFLSGSSTSLNSQKEGSTGVGKKRSSGPLKEREGYGRYATLGTYERLKGMSDQQIYYWIYRYYVHQILGGLILLYLY